jgi:hypothetical protein
MGIIIDGQVIGVRIGGRANTAGWTEQNVGGVPIKFQPGDNLSSRQVQIGGGMTTTLMAGSSTSMNVNGISVRSQGHDLWVNGQKVDFSDGAAPADVGGAKKSAKERLEERFPGVQFTGHDLVQIEEGVKIAAGARIDGVSAGTVITGDSKIGPNAHIAGGAIDSSTVDGRVRDANLRDSTVERDGVVTEANLRDTTVGSGGRITGGNVRDSTIKNGGAITGGNVRDMTIESGASLTGGNVRGFTLKSGESITGGNHSGGISQANANAASVVIRGGSFSSDVNITLGNVSRGVTVIGEVGGGMSIVGGRVTINGVTIN